MGKFLQKAISRTLQAITWILLALACVIFGELLNASAEAFGITDSVYPHRGEWYPLVAPFMLALSLSIGAPSFIYLRRSIPVRRLVVFCGITAIGSLALYVLRPMAVAA